MSSIRAAMLAVLLLGAAACGSSGNGCPTLPAQPVETDIYVSGVSGTNFAFASTPMEAECHSSGTGIQAPNASHQFGDRVFQTPHLFVLENIQQPVRAVIQNLDQTTPIRVDVYLGINPQNSNVVIEPGHCETVQTNTTLPLNPRPCGDQIQVEVCSPSGISPSGTPGLDLTIPCMPQTPGPNTPAPTPSPTLARDLNVTYTASIGDVSSSVNTNCILSPILNSCQTPSTFFFEQPVDEIAAVMAVNPNQNPGFPLPNAAMRLELYVNGPLLQVSTGGHPAVSDNL
jgi:hypothetical protein